ncbi:aminoacyl-histidine dipeptidase [Brachyspira sp. G79]|uniref:aminoacyl-histidine dipeptidase n=1 Tax=Brachyspira sp. G79 TaxID=1358104 RepID=UPI000BBC9AA5|nr:aminoacyl-histidine dipeptidase [Brachyspira sp. G79]PCG19158.1 aminoacyl-histidine dipeptidase [Brachyspira sp. G79]
MDLNNFNDLDSKEVFRWFAEISKIPRESGHEKEVSDFLVKFAKDRNLEVYQDEKNNVIIKKKATSGYENLNPVIIQGHMDMVCEKTKESTHDFRKDPIELVVEGDILRAKDTTLGADDGIAVAMGLALLDSKDIPHPALNILFTTSEETNMGGAAAVTGEHLDGKTLINVDAEEEGIFLVSCAGGVNTLVSFDIKRESNSNEALKIEVSGLKGGHSGLEIDKQRANAIKVLGRLLYAVKNDVNIACIEGGAKHNAIAKSADAVITAKDIDKVKGAIEKLADSIKSEYKVEDPDMNITVSKADSVKECYTKDLTERVIDLIMLAPDGVLYMSRDIQGLVQTSANNGVLKEEKEKLTLTISIRSSVESSLNEITSRIETAAARTNASYKAEDGYPAWEYDENSKVKNIACDVYKKITKKDAKIEAVHAGLECGILKKALPNVDMISIGPNIWGAHTPEEHLSISSADTMWKVLKELIISIK